jgi:hypothetical protein
VVMSMMRDILVSAKPPRSVFVNFPADHPLGRPLDVDFQIKTLKFALNSLTGITEPGEVRDLPHRWSEDFSWQYWPGAMVCYMDKTKSRLKQQKIWYDENGKAHRKTEYNLAVPGWTHDWEGK